MKKLDLFKLVWTNLWRMRVRTVLTTIGVIIGTTAIVTMVSLGIGVQKNLNKQLGTMGSITDISVTPKYNFEAGSDPSAGLQDPVKPLNDAALREIRKISGVVAAVPTVTLNGVELTFGHFRSSALVTGIDPVEGEKLGVRLESGRYLNRGDDQVIVLGYKLPEHFQAKSKAGNKGRRIGGNSEQSPSTENEFALSRDDYKVKSEAKPRVDLLHKTISLSFKKLNTEGETTTMQEGEETKTIRVRVVGIMAETGGSEDFSAVIPLKMAGNLVKWRDNLTSVQKKGYETIIVRVETPEMVEQVQQKIDKLGYSSFSLKQMLAAVNNISKILQVLLGGIGGIALLVASFGIMNTMIMSIYERTREIGIMKVIGASVGDIKQIFLLEAGSIGFLGGVIGLLIGWTGAQLVNLAASAYFSGGGGNPVNVVFVPLWLAIFAVSFATMVGLLAGVYPSLRAAKLSPLEAIRQE